MQKTMKKLLSIILAILMIVTTIPMAFAADVVKSGNCGANGGNVKWTLDSDGTLTISGTGDMQTFANLAKRPWYDYTHDIKKIIIEDGVTSISDYTAYGCFVATSISIGKDVKSIGPSVTTFYCRDLETITVSEDNEYYKAVDNVLFSKDGKELLKVAPKALSGTYNVPDGVVKIDEQAFNVCPYIEKVVLPDSVEEIGKYAFYECDSLEILDIGMAKLSSFGENIFANIKTPVEVIADKDNEYVSVVNGSLFSKIDGTLFYAYVTDNKCVVPYGVKIIPESTIFVEDGSVVVPDTVETIERYGIDGYDSVVHYLGTESQFQEIYEGDMSEFDFEWLNMSMHYCVQQSNIPASCTDDGVTEWYCSTCDETIKYVTGYAFGHDIVKVDAKAPTCTEIGWDAYEYCTECDYTTKVEIPVDPDAHDWSNKDGICARENCGYECVHANYADGACDNCDVKQKYTVRMETKLSKGVEFVGNPVAIHGEDLIIEFKNLVSEKCNDVSLFELTIGANSFYEFEFDENGITFDGTVLTIPGELVNGDVETHANAYTQARIKLNGGKFSPECPPDIVEEYFIENDYAISNKMLVGYNNSVKDTFVKDKHTIKSILASDGNDYNKIYYFSPNSDLEMTIEWECLPENFENGVCVECGYECPHEWSEGSLVRPTRTEEGYYTYTCSICKDTKTELVERPANYAEFKELLEKVKGYLDENLTDSMMQEVNNIINFFDLDENHRFIKGEENTVSQNIRQISEFVEVVEEGIADGTAVKVDGFTVYNERGREWLLKFADEGIFEKARELILNSTEVKAKMDEIYDFALSLEGNVAENAENIAKIEADVDEFFGQLKKCVYGIHNVSQYKEISPAKCGENAVESATCTLCGETVTREVENSALKHSFTKYEVTEEAKCGVAGKEVAYCDNGCGETDEKAIGALKHDIVIDEAVAPKCGETGLTQGEHCTRCDYKVEQDVVPALEHKDADGDYKCDNGCGHEFEKPAPEEPTPDTPDEPSDDACDHLCHKSGILGFFWKIVKFFWKLFRMNPVCECGVAHY